MAVSGIWEDVLPATKPVADVAGDERRAALDEYTAGVRRVLKYWGLMGLLRVAGPHLPDLWREGE